MVAVVAELAALAACDSYGSEPAAVDVPDASTDAASADAPAVDGQPVLPADQTAGATIPRTNWDPDAGTMYLDVAFSNSSHEIGELLAIDDVAYAAFSDTNTGSPRLGCHPR